MPKIRLIRAVGFQSTHGPWNGQFALQKALRRRLPDWLAIGGPLQRGEIPWFWCWLDRAAAAMCAAEGRPFVVGPNILFDDSRRPCQGLAERDIINAASCRLMFTESEWYRRLIEEHRGPCNRAPIVLWPYPIDPKPAGPLPPTHDLLIYAKSGFRNSLVARLRHVYRRTKVIRYGRYRRGDLFEAARRSRACVYLSDDDRGPLALAEILLTGCPAVGTLTGAPFIQLGRTGIFLDRLGPSAIIEAIENCHELDRQSVSALAAEQFDTDRILNTLLAALERARG